MAKNSQEHVTIHELGTLMAKGKQAGFITYEELNKHLPGGLVSADRVEQLINVFTEMGVEVVDPERAPTGAYAMRKDRLRKEDSALRADTSQLGTVVRIDDPVRMYLREMGTVELLTREGEIEIARRIEEGRMQVHEAICLCPSTFREIMLLGERIIEIRDEALASGEEPNFRDIIDVDEKVVNSAAIKEYENRMNRSEDDDEPVEAEPKLDAEQLSAAIKARKATPDGTPMMETIITKEEQLEEALGHFGVAKQLHDEFIILKKKLDKKPNDGPLQLKSRQVLDAMLLELVSIPFSPRQLEQLVQRFKNAVERVRRFERTIRDYALKARMPRKMFLETFPPMEADERWVDSILRQHKDAALD